MDESGRRLGSSDINPYLWLCGWNPAILCVTLSVVFLILGAAVGAPFAGFLGLLVGLVAWAAGVSHVNDHYESVLDEYDTICEQAAEEHLSLSSPDTESYLLPNADGNPLLIEPATEYMTRTVVVADNSVAIHRGVGLEMKYRSPTLEDDTEEIYYDQISSVTYSEPDLRIITSDGGEFVIPSTREPDDVLEDLQSRLREYKQA